jgi:hypothetical protein
VPLCLLSPLADAIRRSQQLYWYKRGEGPEWERKFYEPETLLSGHEVPGPSGFLRNWSRVFDWYRAQAQYRMKNMREAYTAARSAFFAEVERLRGLTQEDVDAGLSRGSLFEYFAWTMQVNGELTDGAALNVSRWDVTRVFWEFEAFAQNIRSALDTLVRLVAPCYPQPVPTSISKFSRRGFPNEVAAQLVAAWTGWGHRLAEYRDCVVHYTPLALEPFMLGRKEHGKWRVGCYLPDNPSAKHVDRFRFSSQLDVLVYSERVLKSLDRLASKVAELLLGLWRRGLYPTWPGPYFS